LETQSGVTEKVVDWLAKGSSFQVGPHADRLYHFLISAKQPMEDNIAECLSIGAPIAGVLTQQASRLIELYLSPGYESAKARIIELAVADPSDQVEKELQGFVFEGIRLAGAVLGFTRVATKDITIEDGAQGPITIKSGHTIIAATSKASLDPVAFPDPTKPDPHRPIADYAALGYGFNSIYGSQLIGGALAATLREIFKLKNVRKADGKLGIFTTTGYEIASGLEAKYYLDSNANESVVPTSLTLQYDD